MTPSEAIQVLNTFKAKGSLEKQAKELAIKILEEDLWIYKDTDQWIYKDTDQELRLEQFVYKMCTGTKFIDIQYVIVKFTRSTSTTDHLTKTHIVAQRWKEAENV